MLLRELLDNYLAMRPSLSSGAVHQLRVSVSVFEEWLGREAESTSINAGRLTDFLRAYAPAVSPTTANKKISNLLTLLQSAGLAVKVQHVPIPRLIPRAWSVQELAQIVTATRTLRGFVGPWPKANWFRALLLTTYSTASRISAVMGIRTRDVSLTDRLAVVFEPKTRREEVKRLTDQCVDSLRAIWDSTRQELFSDWPYDRTQPDWQALNGVLAKCIRSAGVPDIGRFHAIRKTSATLVFDRDRHAATILLGHTNEAITRDHYVDPTKLTQPLPGDLLPALSI